MMFRISSARENDSPPSEERANARPFTKFGFVVNVRKVI
jgi:hypothetical protein